MSMGATQGLHRAGTRAGCVVYISAVRGRLQPRARSQPVSAELGPYLRIGVTSTNNKKVSCSAGSVDD
jgi:hypothetical protein